jgi:hypothetical protein
MGICAVRRSSAVSECATLKLDHGDDTGNALSRFHTHNLKLFLVRLAQLDSAHGS